MSHVKRYLDTRKQNYAHDVARIAAALDMNGWQLLAEAIRKDFAEPTMGESLAAFWSETEPTQEELFEACDVMSASLKEDGQRRLSTRVLCRANGLDPDEKDGAESSAETRGLADVADADDRAVVALADKLERENAALETNARVDAEPPTL